MRLGRNEATTHGTFSQTHFLKTSIDESGTSSVELALDAEAQTLIYARPTLQFGARTGLSETIDLEAYASVGLTGFLDGNSSDASTRVTGSFTNASAAAGTFQTRSSLDDVIFDLDAGLSVSSQDGWHVRAEGFARFSENISQGGGGLRMGFSF